MDNRSKESLPVGRAALAKTICIDWATENSKTILYSFLALIFLGFGLFQWTAKFSSGKKSDYLEVQKAYSAWIGKETRDLHLFDQLEQPLSRHPELEAKFGTRIAQRLLALGEVNKADAYATAALKRAEDLTTPYYTQFSRNTLVIAQGKYKEALEESKRLKTALEEDDAFWASRDRFVKSGTVLYAYNLLRIAALERELGSKEGELKAWEELVRNAGWRESSVHLKTYDPEAYALLAQNFAQGEVSLLDYIEQREKQLKN